jgi:hypothetical protein
VLIVQLVTVVAGTAVIFGALGFTGRHHNVLFAGVMAAAYAAATGFMSGFLYKTSLAKANRRRAMEEHGAGLS